MRRKIIALLVAWTIVIAGGISLASAESMHSVRRGFSDRWIAWRVDALLQNDNRLDYREVRVTTKDKIVTLKGSVMTDYEKAHATLVAGDIPGVKGVTNEIVVVEPVDADFALIKRVHSEIIQDPTLKVMALDVDAREGGVTLYGIVRSVDQKKRVGELVQGVPGVKELKNEILVE